TAGRRAAYPRCFPRRAAGRAQAKGEVVSDPRVEQYARVMVEECVDVQPGWQVIVFGGHLGRPLLEEICRQGPRREAHALLRVGFGGSLLVPTAWAQEAPIDLLLNPAPLETAMLEQADALIVVEAPENTRNLSVLSAERLNAIQTGSRPAMERIFTGELKWVGGQFPTPALAQEAGRSDDAVADCVVERA